MLKLAMCDIDREIREQKLEGKMILQVHDELVFDVPKSEEDAFHQIIQKYMSQVLFTHEKKIIPEYANLSGELSNESLHDHHPSHLPIVVDIHSGKNWVEAKS